MILPLLLTAMGAAAQGTPAAPSAPPPFVMPPPPAPPGPRAEIVRGLEPRQPIESLFSSLDYPQALQGTGNRGVVSVILTIDVNGRVVSCGIQQSSAEELSMMTCNILRRRARFTPAMDSNGNAVIGQIPVQVDWDAVFARFE